MRYQRVLRTLVLAAAATAASAPARAQFRAGFEFRVNSITTAGAIPRIAVQRDGEFVITWNGIDEDDGGVFARLYREDGTPRGAEFRVNTTTAATQVEASVALDGREFVVAWTSYAQDGSYGGVFGRRFDKDGSPVGGEFQVNTYTTGRQHQPRVAKDRREGRRGGFVVVWADYEQDYGSIMARRYDARGVALGDQFRVNVYTTFKQVQPQVGAADDGRFVVAWDSYEQSIDSVAVARVFDAAGNPVTGELHVGGSSLSGQYVRSVAVTPDGRFVVVWDEFDSSYSSSDVFARRFDAAGQPQGPPFRVNASTTAVQWVGSVAVNERGDFSVSWRDYARDGSASGVAVQRFDRAGNRWGQDFVVNTYTTGYQLMAETGMDAVGNFTVAWTSLGQDGSASGVYAQRFGGILFPRIRVDVMFTPGPGGSSSDRNGVLEPGETVTVEPFWRNVSGGVQTSFGTVLAFTGPPGPTYTVPDPNANFSEIPNGATWTCSSDCYLVAVSGARPATHWDGVMEEGNSSSLMRQVKGWTLHVGDSFGDVPRSSSFYRSIETLLHKGVTSGCAASAYCPQGITTREQMAVFVLVAAEGAGFTPVACGATPMFNDVPVSSPFCPWVEELARRGVTGGCGGGDYCPSAAVPREQMPVFVLRTLDDELDPPPCTTPMFDDVPASSPYCRWIEELARRGVVGGCAPSRYCPQDAVTREQMAIFLTGTFALELYGP